MRCSLAVTLALLAGCSRVDAPATTPPPAPVRANPPVQLGSMQVECDALIAALATYKTCAHLEDEDREDLDGWIEITNRNVTAGAKSNPEPNAQAAIAAACRKATVSVDAAHERCKVGPRPKRPDEQR